MENTTSLRSLEFMFFVDFGVGKRSFVECTIIKYCRKWERMLGIRNNLDEIVFYEDDEDKEENEDKHPLIKLLNKVESGDTKSISQVLRYLILNQSYYSATILLRLVLSYPIWNNIQRSKLLKYLSNTYDRLYQLFPIEEEFKKNRDVTMDASIQYSSIK
jgi:hypothetical protein